MKIGSMIMTVALLAGMAEAKNLLPTEQVKPTLLSGVYDLREILWDAQELLVDISPPQMEVFNHRDEMIYAVDWRDMPSELKRRMYATMVYGFPVYELRMETDPVFRDTIFKNARGVEVYRLPPPSFKKYDPYAYLKKKFSVSSYYEIDEWNRWIFDWAHTGCTIQMLPKTLHTDFLDELAYRESQEQAIALPMKMMAMGASGISKPMAHMTQGTNGIVLEISLPVGFGRYMEIFRRTDLTSASWAIEDSWIPTFENTNVVWTDTSETNKCFYHISNAVDSDGDGFSNLREAWFEGTNSNSFDTVNDDGDSMHDWFELAIFGHTNQTDITDFDGDGLSDSWEMNYRPGTPPTVDLRCDPTLEDTDNDGVDDYYEVNGTPPTDPWDPDTSAPSVNVGSPATGTTIVP